ncbi:MAG: hypothetical protein ACYC1D_02950 [Acidimicrobiales bacterium]
MTRSTDGSTAPARRHTSEGKGQAAATHALRRDTTAVRLPLVQRSVTLPPPGHLAWYAGVALLTALEMIDWPVALILTAGRLMADNRNHQTLQAFGDALDHAV